MFLLRPRARLLLGSTALLAVGVTATASAVGAGPFALTDVRTYAAAHGLVPDAPPPAAARGLGPDAPARAAAPPASFGVTPQAPCGPGSRPETGRQGRVPSADYANGRAAQGYTCNAQVLSHVRGTGGFQVHRYVDRSGRECAFYDSTLIFPKDAYKGGPLGTYVMDMSNPAKPRRTTVLQTPAMLSPHESLRLDARRGLLVAAMGSPTTQVGVVDVYDVSQDCRQPVLRSSVPLGGLGHEGGFSPDGRTYWSTTTAREGITAIDLTNPAAPTVLWHSERWTSHGMSLSADGNRAYLASPCCDYISSTTKGGGGLIVLDVSQIQKRTPNPVVTEVSRLTWPEVTIPQNSIPVTIGGRKYLLEFDEYSSNVYQYGPNDHVGAVRLIDMADEKKPKVVSRIRLAVHEKAARATDQKDDPGAQRVGQGYSAHYCSVPREVEPGIVACGMILSGLRVFDIRDPLRPREIAYANHPLTAGPDSSERGAYAMSAPAFAPERREIWYSDANAGFFVVRLSERAWPRSGRD